MTHKTAPKWIILAATLAPLSLSHAATLSSVANGNYTDGTTWSDGNAPTAGNDYNIGHVVSSSNTATLAGDSVTVNSGGTLRSDNTATNPNKVLTVNNLTLNGGELFFDNGGGNPIYT